MEAIVQVLLKLLGNSQLQNSRGLNVQFLQHLNIRMDLQAADFPGDWLACTVQPPFCDDAIGGQPALHAGRFTIEVGIVAPHNDTQLLEIEVSIASLEWIECPFDEPNSAFDGKLPLSKFEASPDTLVSKNL